MQAKTTLVKQKTFSDIAHGGLNAYGSLSKSPLLSNIKNTPSYQFSKSGLNSRSQHAGKTILGLSQPATPFSHQQPQDRTKPSGAPVSRRDSVNQKSSDRIIQFEKQAKTSVSQLKYPAEARTPGETRNLGAQSALTNLKNDNKREATLTSTLENVQRLNEEIKNQSSELMKSTSVA